MILSFKGFYMRALISCLIVLFASATMASSVLNVPANSTYVIKEHEQRMTLSSLTLGDNAIISFAQGVTQWQLRAESAVIGKNVVIDASGLTGKEGVAGSSLAQPQAEACRHGVSGNDGTPGGHGGDGLSVRIQLGIQAIGQLTIKASGGAGGNGGNGGNGQAAGESKSCRTTPRGGNAGMAGNGGNGGSAGDISVTAWVIGSQLNIERALSSISAVVQGGAPGSKGLSGKPGAGSEGHYIKKRTLTGNRAWQAGGKPGLEAKPAKSGVAGAKGRAVVEQAFALTPVTRVKAPARSLIHRDDELKAIKQALGDLMKRIEALEK